MLAKQHDVLCWEVNETDLMFSLDGVWTHELELEGQCRWWLSHNYQPLLICDSQEDDDEGFVRAVD